MLPQHLLEVRILEDFFYPVRGKRRWLLNNEFIELRVVIDGPALEGIAEIPDGAKDELGAVATVLIHIAAARKILQVIQKELIPVFLL